MRLSRARVHTQFGMNLLRHMHARIHTHTHIYIYIHTPAYLNASNNRKRRKGKEEGGVTSFGFTGAADGI